MTKNIIDILKKDIWFHIFSTISLMLIIISFILPPTGIIDPSIFAAVGEIFAFASLYEVHRAIDRGTDVKMTKDDVTIEINNSNTDKTNTIDSIKTDDDKISILK